MSRIEEALAKAAKSEHEESRFPTPLIEPQRIENLNLDWARDQRLVPSSEPASGIAEEYKKIRMQVLEAMKSGKNTLLVTSARNGEGKTLTALNLALTIAETFGRSVLLIDADLRCPNVHNVLGLESGPGLSDVLSQQKSLSEVLRRVAFHKFTVLPGGAPVSNAAEILSSDQMTRLLEEVKYRYEDRIVILDSPPLLPVTDSAILSRIVDWALFVVQAGNTPREEIIRALSLLEREKILGVVFNRVAHALGPVSSYSAYYATHNGLPAEKAPASRQRTSMIE